MVQSDGSYCVLLGILGIAIHTIELGFTPWRHILVLGVVLVLLVAINLTIRNLIYAIVRLLLSFVVNLALIHIVEVFLALCNGFGWPVSK